MIEIYSDELPGRFEEQWTMSYDRNAEGKVTHVYFDTPVTDAYDVKNANEALGFLYALTGWAVFNCDLKERK